jgi:hypothetical protein
MLKEKDFSIKEFLIVSSKCGGQKAFLDFIRE